MVSTIKIRTNPFFKVARQEYEEGGGRYTIAYFTSHLLFFSGEASAEASSGLPASTPTSAVTPTSSTETSRMRQAAYPSMLLTTTTTFFPPAPPISGPRWASAREHSKLCAI